MINKVHLNKIVELVSGINNVYSTVSFEKAVSHITSVRKLIASVQDTNETLYFLFKISLSSYKVQFAQLTDAAPINHSHMTLWASGHTHR